MKQVITSNRAPAPIGPYSQAIKAGQFVFLSGQIALAPGQSDIVKGDLKTRVRQIFDNIQALAQAAGGSMAQIVKLTIYLTDMARFPEVNEVMLEYFAPPFPARTTIAVAALPKGTDVEVDATLIVSE